jgi:hypothetical protein
MKCPACGNKEEDDFIRIQGNFEIHRVYCSESACIYACKKCGCLLLNHYTILLPDVPDKE